MLERVPCEFFLVRYVPDVVKGEFVNIGVLLRDVPPGPQTEASIRLRFTRDWSRVRCLDAGADIALLEDLEQELSRRLAAGSTEREPASLLSLLESSLSNSVQLTAPRAALAENLTVELEQLMRLYVEPMRPVRPSRKEKGRTTGRTAILSSMRSHFERAEVWQLMNKRVPAEPYTRRGDPLRIDCGYKRESPGDAALRLFQAVSLDGEMEMARVLAFAAPHLREGVARLEKMPLELTAVVEPLHRVAERDGEAKDRYRFGVETMEQYAIRVITMHDLARVAETARHDLGL